MQSKTDIKVFIGIAIIVAGVILFLDNSLGFNLHINFFELWPLILIAIGANYIMQPAQSRQSFTGYVLLGIGILFLLDNLDVIYFDFGDLWPLILILIGVSMLRKHMYIGVFSAKDENKEDVGGPDFINLSFILGGGDHVYTSKKLKGGHISAFMGGGKIDLRQASCEGDTLILDTFAFWGGIEIIVPYHWTVNIHGTPILGGMENQTRSMDNVEGIEINLPPKTLIVRGSAIMGAVEVKN